MGLRIVKIVAEFADGLLLMLPTLGHTQLVVQTAQSIAKKRSMINQFRIACHFITVISDNDVDNSILTEEARRMVTTFCAIHPHHNSFGRMAFRSELSKIDDELSSNSGEEWRSVTQQMADSLIVHQTAEKRVKKKSNMSNLV